MLRTCSQVSFPDRQLFADLHGHTPGREPVTPLDALAHLLRVPANARRLIESLQQARSGQREERDLAR
jgi:hypothetical protein